MSFPCFSYSEAHQYSNLSLKPSTKLCLLDIEDTAIASESLQSSYRLLSPCAFDTLPFLLNFFFLKFFLENKTPNLILENRKKQKETKITHIPLPKTNYPKQFTVSIHTQNTHTRLVHPPPPPMRICYLLYLVLFFH